MILQSKTKLDARLEAAEEANLKSVFSWARKTFYKILEIVPIIDAIQKFTTDALTIVNKISSILEDIHATIKKENGSTRELIDDFKATFEEDWTLMAEKLKNLSAEVELENKRNLTEQLAQRELINSILAKLDEIQNPKPKP